jgi:cell division septation protein DedD
MTNNREQQQKDGIMKSLAIVGFIGLIISVAWLGIQLVKVLPNAFTSLASLADSVYSYDTRGLMTTSNKSTVSDGESVTISWNVPKRSGTFAFSYVCTEGLALDMRDSLGAIRALTCDTNYTIGSVSAIDVVATTEKNRFTNLSYHIDFIPSGKESPLMSDEGALVIVNATIGTTSTPEPAVASSTLATTTPVVTEKPAEPVKPVTPAKPTTSTKPVAPTKPIYTQKPVYSIPTSNPNGFTDLSVAFVGSGILVDQTFKSTGVIDNDETGAIKFEVKNIGTKTSNTWTYSAKLPNGETYTSTSQAALKPNEQAIITLGFTMGDDTGAKRYNVEVSVTPDSNRNNNSFETAVAIVE